MKNIFYLIVILLPSFTLADNFLPVSSKEQSRVNFSLGHSSLDTSFAALDFYFPLFNSYYSSVGLALDQDSYATFNFAAFYKKDFNNFSLFLGAHYDDVFLENEQDSYNLGISAKLGTEYNNFNFETTGEINVVNIMNDASPMQTLNQSVSYSFNNSFAVGGYIQRNFNNSVDNDSTLFSVSFSFYLSDDY